MEYDVIIIGARVAGASLALHLGRQGRRVLLVDRDRFPSDTLSTHFIGGFGVARLAELGVLEDVEARGLRRIGRMCTHIEDCIVDAPVVGPGPYNYALAPRRTWLDDLLIRNALRQPTVAFRELTSAEGLAWQDGRVVGARLRSAGRAEETVHAPVVVGADGRNSKVAAWVDARPVEESPAARPGYYAYYRGVEEPPEPAAELFVQGAHVGFLFPMEPGVCCLAVELQPDDFAAFRDDPGGCLDERMAGFPGMAGRMAAARREGPAAGFRGVANFVRPAFGPGWALTGDAVCCKDPITGTGINDALNEAVFLAEALGRHFDGAAWEGALGAYRRKLDEQVVPLYRAAVATAFEDAPSTEALAWFRAALCNPFWARQLAANFPAALAAPGVFPPAALARMRLIARLFGARTGLPPAPRATA